MSERWYYTHNRQSHGPLSRAEIKLLAARGLLAPQDPVWREGADRKTAVQANTVVEFAPQRPQAGPLPSWLNSVETAEAAKPRAAWLPAAPPATRAAARPASSAPPPGWLGDVRLVEALPRRPAKPIALPSPSSLPLDWLEDIHEIERSFRTQPKAPSAVPPAPPGPGSRAPAGRPLQSAAPPVAKPSPAPVVKPASAIPPAKPPGIAAPAAPAALRPAPPTTAPTIPPTVARPPAAPRTPERAAPVTPPAATPPRVSPAVSSPPTAASAIPRTLARTPSPTVARAPDGAVPVTPPAAIPPKVSPAVPPPAAVPAVAEPASAVAPSVPLPATPSQAEPASPETTGYDAETGQVLDAAKYARWRREQLTVKEQPAMTVYEAFLTARQSLQEWVDAEASKPLVLAGDIDSIKQNPAVIALVQTYKGYGPTMVEKLSKHLDFIVDNRRQFYAAFAGKLG